MTQRPPGTTTTRDIRMHVAGYRILDILGDGGSGIVYAAEDARGRPVALKVLKPELVGPKERQRFLDEAARLSRVRHPALVELLDAGPLDDGGAYIAMVRLEGRNLLERLQAGPLRFDRALALFEQVAGALSALHQAGLVHRDVKPENIFVEAGDARAILLDLGIARDIAADPSTTTRAGLIRGSPAYMAPERFFGKPATPQTDIYELAVVLYMTLVGGLPWASADDPTQRLHPVAPAQRGVVLPPRLQTTLMRALSSQVGERPQTADEFATAVIDALSPQSMQLVVGQQTGRAHAVPAPPVAATAQLPPGSGAALPTPPPGLAAWAFPPPNATTGAPMVGAASTGPSPNRSAAPFVVVGVLLVLVLVLGGTAAFFYGRASARAPEPAVLPAADAAIAAVATVAPPVVSPASSLPAAVRSKPRDKGAASADAPLEEPAGKCRCLPNGGNSEHGDNMALARRFSKLACSCSGALSMCQVPLAPCKDFRGGTCQDFFSTRCPQQTRVGEKPGAPCTGFTSSGEQGTGKWSCQFAGDQDVYAGPAGRPCVGFMVTGEQTQGRTFCARR